MDDCIFCKIVEGKLPCTKIYEDDDVIAFMDIMPVNKGHCIVIPKEHYSNILEVPDELLQRVSVALKRVCMAVKAGVNAGGISVIQRNLKAADQIVPHLHFNVIPRFDGDGLKEWPQKTYADGEKDALGKKIARFI